MSTNQLAWFFCKFQLGKQEDAEEFLSCILDGMHEEMSAAVNLNTNNVDTQGRFNFVVNLSLYEFIQVQWKFVAYWMSSVSWTNQ